MVVDDAHKGKRASTQPENGDDNNKALCAVNDVTDDASFLCTVSLCDATVVG